jgi:CheY-like chemotaxis protein
MSPSITGKEWQTRDVPYGSETILIVGEPAEARASCREVLSRCGYQVLEAANFQHADTILDQLDGNLDLILGCAPSNGEGGSLAVWYSHYWTFPLLVLNPEEHQRTPGMSGAEIALKVRLALEAARPSRSILVVDEDPAEREMIADVLKTAGYDVRQASNGKEAMARLTADTPEFLLTDIVMPEKDGLELLQEVRKRYPNIASIAMSGTASADRYLTIARLLGAKRTMEKPVSIDQLLRFLREVQSAG